MDGDGHPVLLRLHLRCLIVRTQSMPPSRTLVVRPDTEKSGEQVQAVDSEFTGVQQDDQSRLMGAMCHMARRGHPLRTFMWGNKRSLWDEPRAAGIDVRRRIIEHYKQQYSANRMRLVILSGHSLDELQQWAEDLFTPVRLRCPFCIVANCRRLQRCGSMPGSAGAKHQAAPDECEKGGRSV